MILISNVRTSASKKKNRMSLTWSPTVLTTALENTKEKFYSFRQTVNSDTLSSFLSQVGGPLYLLKKEERYLPKQQSFLKFGGDDYGNCDVNSYMKPMIV